MKFTDLVNKRYGRLVVTKRIGLNKWNQAIWECKCDCGVTTNAITTTLNRGKKRSCGCLKQDQMSRRLWKGYEDISGDYWSSVQRNAKNRNIAFNVTIENAWTLYLQQNKLCSLSGLPIEFSRNVKSGEQTASLDRIDPKLGYTNNNIQWLHKTINMCKHTLTNEEFVSMCKNIANRF